MVFDWDLRLLLQIRQCCGAKFTLLEMGDSVILP